VEREADVGVTFTPSDELKVIDSSTPPLVRVRVQTTFCTLVGKMMICSVIGL
jgi:hypothetical protein